MKQIIVILACCIGITAMAQTAKYGELKEGRYKEYVSKNDFSFRVGDTLKIGTPYNNGKFVSIFKDNPYFYKFKNVYSKYSGKHVVIKSILVNKKLITWITTNDDIPLYINIETAIEFGEIEYVIHQIIDTNLYLADNQSQIVGINFYENWDRMYKAKLAGLFTGIAAGGFTIGGALLQVNNANNGYSANGTINGNGASIALYAVGGVCGLVSFACYIINIAETKSIRDKHSKITFTPNGVVVKF